MSSKLTLPKALQEVWNWEEQIYKETKEMDLKEYVQYIRCP